MHFESPVLEGLQTEIVMATHSKLPFMAEG